MILDEKYKHTSFCPLCESLMKDGICTNKKCQNTQIEIDFMKANGIYEGCIKDKRYIINGSYMVGFGFNHQLYYQVSNGDGIISPLGLSEIKNLYRNDIPVNFKLIGFGINEVNSNKPDYNKPYISHLRVYGIEEALRKKNVQSIYKYYLELSEVRIEDFNIPARTLFGSNDLLSWRPLNEKYPSSELIAKIKILLGYCEAVANSWTLQITNKNNGFKTKTFFDKECAYNVFKDREIKEGRIRRTALKHVVGEYIRHIPKEILVDEHFRGDITFQWRGLNFELKPSLVIERKINLKQEE